MKSRLSGSKRSVSRSEKYAGFRYMCLKRKFSFGCVFLSKVWGVCHHLHHYFLKCSIFWFKLKLQWNPCCPPAIPCGDSTKRQHIPCFLRYPSHSILLPLTLFLSWFTTCVSYIMLFFSGLWVEGGQVFDSPQ